MAVFIIICIIVVCSIILLNFYAKSDAEEKTIETSQKSSTEQENSNLKEQIEILRHNNFDLLKENQNLRKVVDEIPNVNKDSIKEQINLKNQILSLQAQVELLQKKNSNLLTENGNYIKENQELLETIHQFNPDDDYRKRYPSPYRCDDGDWVRSKAEREIDNFFYRHRIWHIIEEVYYKRNTNTKYYPDFYLPDYNLYLEYFGGTDPDYLFKKEAKISTYRSDYSIKFEYLTYDDDTRIEERLREICRKYSIPL